MLHNDGNKSWRNTQLIPAARQVRLSRCSFPVAALARAHDQPVHAGQILHELRQAGAFINVAVASTPQHGLGLIWAPQDERVPGPTLKHQDTSTLSSCILVASIPGSHILSCNISGACKGLQLQPGLAPVFTHAALPIDLPASTDSLACTDQHVPGLSDASTAADGTGMCSHTAQHSNNQGQEGIQSHNEGSLIMDGQLRNAALLLWAVLAGDEYLNGFWARYATSLLPPVTSVVSLLTYTPAELRLLKDGVLVHASLAWRRQVQRWFDHYISSVEFHQGLPPGSTASWEQWVWAVACVESRAYGFKVGSEQLSAFVPIWGEANHMPGTPTVSRIHHSNCSSTVGAGAKTREEQPSNTDRSLQLSNVSVALYLDMQVPTSASSEQSSPSDQLGIGVQSEPVPPPAGSTICTNYGEKSSRMLMEQYGFVIPGNVSDHITVHPSHAAGPHLIRTHPHSSHASQGLQLKPGRVLVHAALLSQQENLQGMQGLGSRWRRPSATLLASGAQQHSGSPLLIRRDRLTAAVQKLTSAQLRIDLTVDSGQLTGASAAAGSLLGLLNILITSTLAQLSGAPESPAQCSNPQASFHGSEAAQWVHQQLEPFFCDAAHVRRLQLTAASMSNTYGCKSMAQYKSLNTESELACVHQAHFCIATWMLLCHPNTLTRVCSTPCGRMTIAATEPSLSQGSSHWSSTSASQLHPVHRHITDCLQWHVQQLLSCSSALQDVDISTKHERMALRPAAMVQAHLYRLEQLLVGLAAVELLQVIHGDLTSDN